MAWKSIYASALAAAFAAFALSGGIHATEIAADAVQQEVAAPAATKPALAKPATPPLGTEAVIPFADSGAIRNWQPDGSKAVYLQDRRGHWYHATLMNSCFDLPFAQNVAFETQGTNQFDKYSAIMVRGQRCQISSLVTSAGPAKAPAKTKAAPRG